MRQRTLEVPSNERLEFLGDSVLQLVISEYLYDNYKTYREGALTRLRQKLVCEKSLARIGEGLELGKYLNVGHGDEINNLRTRPKVIADAMEALIAAIYLDAHPDEALYKRLIISLFKDEIANLFSGDGLDYKTMLQQFAEQEGSAILEYRTVSEDGPEHNKQFTVCAYVNNNEVGRATASTKKDAEMRSAKMALELFGVI
jgi:ribonuclease-3